MRNLLIIFTLCIQLPLTAQSSVDDTAPNELQLGSQLSDLKAQLYLITGDEDIYSRYDWLKASVKKNIANGIREGVYRGSKYAKLSSEKASKTTLFFFENALFKVRWDFDKADFEDLKAVSTQLNVFLKQRYGEGKPENVGPFKMLVWEAEQHYLQIFEDSESIQVEFRNKALQKTVDGLTG